MPRGLGSTGRYGPPLKEYLAAKDHDRSPSVEAIRRAIRTLSDPEKVTCETFETILSLGHTSMYKHLPILLSEDARAALPACLWLIETYCQGKTRLLLGRSYGFLCLRVLSLFIQFALLSDHGEDKMLFSITGIPTGSIIFPFSGQVLGVISGALGHKSREDPYPRAFGWHVDARSGNEVCFPQIGGWSITHIPPLVNLIWASRAELLLAAQWSTDHFPGLAGFLLWIWSGLTLPLETSEPTPDSNRTWWRFVDIASRYMLRADEIEGAMLGLAIGRSPQSAKTALFNLALDSAIEAHDSTLISRYALSKLQTQCRLTKAAMTFCFAFPNVKNDPNLHKIFRAYFGCFWLELDTRQDPSFFGEMLFYYCQGFVHAITRVAKYNLMGFTILLDLIGEELYELLSAAILIPLITPGIQPSAYTGPFEHVHKHVLTLSEIVKETYAGSLARPSPEFTAHVFPLWYKIYAHLEYLQIVEGGLREEIEYSKRWKNTWLAIGKVLDLDHPILVGGILTCEYPRCPMGPEVVVWNCKHCGNKQYCSARCQQADWTFPADPHQSECKGAILDVASQTTDFPHSTDA